MISEKIIRDPVHDVIAFRLDHPDEALLFRLLNTPQVQRLRQIRQLGMTALVYPGAEHTRYSHSLGVMQTARRILEQLSHSATLDSYASLVCLVAALLHDLGHGPFSHVFEQISGIEHEILTRQIILDPEGDIFRLLSDFNETMPQDVTALLQKPEQPDDAGMNRDGTPAGAPPCFWHDIISSQLDADRFDYLLRDNLMTGCRYGGFDLQWVLHALRIDPATSQLTVTPKGVSAVEAYLQARFHMYRNVYFHKVVRGAEGMLRLALRRARRLAVQGRLEWPRREDVVYKALLGQQLSMQEFADLDDISVMHSFKLWIGSADPVLSKLCHGILYRNLYKSIDLTFIDDPATLQQIIETAHDAVRSAAADSDGYGLFYDEPLDTPYETYRPDQDVGQIWVSQNNAQPISFAEVSPLSQALGRQLMFRRLHVAAGYRDRVQQAIRKYL